jgi:2-polyprenyl-6-hydroxyphenyl methylase/3-demethylubiquinone-9 3-methyltransferase
MNTQTADAAEIGKFDALSHKFWDPKGEFKPLHILNPVRARFVEERAKLRGSRALDVGCGGGLLCEALLRAGAQVTGIDLAEGMIEVAKLHAAEQSLSIDYRVADAESLAASGAAGTFDVVTCMEMLEHVPAPHDTVATLARLARPGGSVFISTINRNLKSFLLAIVGAEYVMKLIPRGTHEYERLIQPAELAAWGRAAGLSLMDVAGLDFNPLLDTCKLTRDPSINYLVHFERT